MRTQCRLLVVLSLLLPTSGGTWAQGVSPLQQVMSTSSLISRPQVFRDMQSKILEKVSSTSPGLHLDDFYDEMSKARTHFIRRIHEARFRLSYARDTISILTLDKSTLTIALASGTDSLNLADVLGKLKREFADRLGQYLVAEVAVVLPPDKKDAIVATLFQVLNSSGLSPADYSGSSSDEYLRGIARIAIDYTFDKAQASSPMTLSAVMLKQANVGQAVRTIDSLLVSSADDLERRIVVVLDRVEYVVNNAVAQASNILVRGNTGIGISKGSGTFGGGIYFAYTSPRFQAGLYANSQFGKGDATTTVTKSLFGLDVQFATDRWQVELLYSMLGEESGSSNETGGGISYRVTPAFIVGIALFCEGSNLKLSSYGITLTPTSNGAPTIFLGLKKVDGSLLMQTSFPIGSSN